MECCILWSKQLGSWVNLTQRLTRVVLTQVEEICHFISLGNGISKYLTFFSRKLPGLECDIYSRRIGNHTWGRRTYAFFCSLEGDCWSVPAMMRGFIDDRFQMTLRMKTHFVLNYGCPNMKRHFNHTSRSKNSQTVYCTCT
jgi:hypothetical protein